MLDKNELIRRQQEIPNNLSIKPDTAAIVFWLIEVCCKLDSIETLIKDKKENE